MKRASYLFFISIMFLLSFTVCTWAADYSSTVMIGQGTTKDEAIQDAIRNAVESATGVFVYSASEVKDFKLVKDQIVTASRGYVKDFNVLSESKSDGIVFVKLNVSVDTASIKSVIRRDIKTTTYEDALKDYATISSLVERNRKYAAILKSISSRPLSDLYKVSFAGYEIINAGISSADIILKFNISPNTFLWDAYYETLRLVSSGNVRYVSNNHIVVNYSIVKTYEWGFDLAGERIYFHEDFNDYIINPRRVELICEMPKESFKLRPILIYDKYIDNRSYQEKDVIWIHKDQTATKSTRDDSVGYFMGNGGVEFKTIHTVKDIDDIKKLPSIKVTLRDVTKKNITYKWN